MLGWIRKFIGRLLHKPVVVPPLQPTPGEPAVTHGNHYYAYDRTDLDYFGCGSLIRAEQAYIRQRLPHTPEEPDKPLAGLALSGGGIRSASFSLGVLQALSYKKCLRNIDYLSTVSGGGYIGCCLSYLVHCAWPIGKGVTGGEDHPFGMDDDNFPLGSYPITGRDVATRPALATQSVKPDKLQYHRVRGLLLRFLRQHASYLTPGNGVDLFSLVAVLLRNSLFSLAFYLTLLLILFATIGRWVLFETPLGLQLSIPPLATLPFTLPGTLNTALWLAIGLLVVYLIAIPGYAFATYFFGKLIRGNLPHSYRLWFEKSIGRVFKAVLLLAIVGAVPYIYSVLPNAGAQGTPSTRSATDAKELAPVSAEAKPSGAEQTPAGADTVLKKYAEVISSIVSVITGLGAVIGLFFQSNRRKKTPLIQTALVYIASISLLYGISMLAYWLVAQWYNQKLSLWWLIVPAVVWVAGWFCNLNYVSMHRYYRDRLAETFTPDVVNVVNAKPSIHSLSVAANSKSLSAMFGGVEYTQQFPGQRALPYHIINANIILANSSVPKFRGRGGDNFILSPQFCGSNATGWATTSSVLYKDITLASAMAISGAAVNTNAGCGGEGVTRTPILSMLLGIFNVRLGYWLLNPKWLHYREEYTSEERHQAASISHVDSQTITVGTKMTRLLLHLSALFSKDETPNMFYPGLGDIVLRQNLNENSALVQLSDGGHFENLGLYELVRRRLPLIIAVDGSADPDFKFEDLANAVQKVRTDFGVLITFEGNALEDLIPQPDENAKSSSSEDSLLMQFAKRGYLLGTIDYANNERGVLLYITTTFTRELSADLYGYRRTHPQFPDEPTGDQFFDEKQFEAYRELGYSLAYTMLNDDKVVGNDVVKQALLGTTG